MSLIWFSLASYGLTQVLMYGKALDKVRPTKGWLKDLLSCSMCTGFWVGLLLWSISGFTRLFNFDESIVTGVICGFAGSAVAYVMCVLFDDNGLKIEKTIYKKGEQE